MQKKIIQSHLTCDFKREMQLNNFSYVYIYASMQVCVYTLSVINLLIFPKFIVNLILRCQHLLLENYK